jgi:putative glycosyltransferase
VTEPVRLSVVTTLYRSAASLKDFYARATAAAALLTPHFELVLVNDGSPDASLAIALELHRADPRVRVVDLSRNFGHHLAIMTGLAYARGELVFLIDCDLDEDPGLLGPFHAELQRSDADLVYGFQQRRRGYRFDRWSGGVFYALFNLLSDTPLPPNVCTVRLMTRRFVRSLLAHRERATSFAALCALTGYDQVGVPIHKVWQGMSSYTLARRFHNLIDAVTSFSARPLVLVFYLGVVISIVAGSMALYLIIRHVFFGTLLAGWPSVIVSIWLMGGLTLFCVGLLGIYLSRIFIETKQRPYTIVRQVYGAEPE